MQACICYKLPSHRAYRLPPSRIIQQGQSLFYLWELWDQTLSRPWPENISPPLVSRETRIIHETDARYTEDELWHALGDSGIMARLTMGSPDPVATELLAATIYGNIIPGGHAWMIFTGASGCGKTTIFNYFKPLEAHKIIAYRAQFKTCHVVSRDLRVSVVDQVRSGGTIMVRDFSSLLVNGFQSFKKLMSTLREVYDGELNVQKTGAQNIRWQGKVGFAIAGTPVVHGFRKSYQDLGERFLYYRMTPHDQPEETFAAELHLPAHMLKTSPPADIQEVPNPFHLELELISQMAFGLGHSKAKMAFWRRMHEEYRTLAVAMAVLREEPAVTADITRRILELSIQGAQEEVYPYLLLLFKGIHSIQDLGARYAKIRPSKNNYTFRKIHDRMMASSWFYAKNGLIQPGHRLRPLVDLVGWAPRKA